MMESGCLNCQDRHDRCHSECPKYKAFKEEKAAIHAAFIQEGKADATRWISFHKYKQHMIKKKGKF